MLNVNLFDGTIITTDPDPDAKAGDIANTVSGLSGSGTQPHYIFITATDHYDLIHEWQLDHDEMMSNALAHIYRIFSNVKIWCGKSDQDYDMIPNPVLVQGYVMKRCCNGEYKDRWVSIQDCKAAVFGSHRSRSPLEVLNLWTCSIEVGDNDREVQLIQSNRVHRLRFEIDLCSASQWADEVARHVRYRLLTNRHLHRAEGMMSDNTDVAEQRDALVVSLQSLAGLMKDSAASAELLQFASDEPESCTMIRFMIALNSSLGAVEVQGDHLTDIYHRFMDKSTEGVLPLPSELLDELRRSKAVESDFHACFIRVFRVIFQRVNGDIFQRFKASPRFRRYVFNAPLKFRLDNSLAMRHRSCYDLLSSKNTTELIKFNEKLQEKE
uniref:RGS domain-containing protein n=1 Tax=Spongospora subterranea TaxID=70186 RepID=A0A0H5RDY0_9EUKA|eukprot:CRZ11762.1 hypothetical protein [Spongospora subterranea]